MRGDEKTNFPTILGLVGDLIARGLSGVVGWVAFCFDDYCSMYICTYLHSCVSNFGSFAPTSRSPSTVSVSTHPSERPVGGVVPVESCGRPAVVGGEGEDGLRQHPFLRQRRRQPAHAGVKLPQHPGEATPVRVGDAPPEAIHGLGRGLRGAGGDGVTWASFPT